MSEEDVWMDDWSEDAATFGDRLAVARERQGMSQAQLAKRLGLRVQTVKNWESDRSEPRANKLQMLAGFLNVSMIWLMTGEGDAPVQREPEGSGTDLAAALAEIRDIRMAQRQLADQLARLEKRLKSLASVA